MAFVETGLASCLGMRSPAAGYFRGKVTRGRISGLRLANHCGHRARLRHVLTRRQERGERGLIFKCLGKLDV